MLDRRQFVTRLEWVHEWCRLPFSVLCFPSESWEHSILHDTARGWFIRVWIMRSCEKNFRSASCDPSIPYLVLKLTRMLSLSCLCVVCSNRNRTITQCLQFSAVMGGGLILFMSMPDGEWINELDNIKTFSVSFSYCCRSSPNFLKARQIPSHGKQTLHRWYGNPILYTLYTEYITYSIPAGSVSISLFSNLSQSAPWDVPGVNLWGKLPTRTAIKPNRLLWYCVWRVACVAARIIQHQLKCRPRTGCESANQPDIPSVSASHAWTVVLKIGRLIWVSCAPAAGYEITPHNSAAWP